MPEKFEQPLKKLEQNFLEYAIADAYPKPDEFIKKLKDQGLDNHAEVYQHVLDICETVKKAGGKAVLVGGSVRDIYFNKISKDFDLEIYGIDIDQLKKVLEPIGKVSEVGRAFGVLKVGFGKDVDIDVSLPRKDSKAGSGHKGFIISTDPFMDVKEAAKRRDFTMNSMLADPLDGTLYDPMNGLDDIKNRNLKITDEVLFKDDPLRIMRALQFMGRFGLNLNQDSARIIMGMTGELKDLPKERFLEEWKKLFLKSQKPSIGLAAGMTLGVFKEIHPQFPPLVETPQDSKHHPEGDAWIHTLMAVDEAAKISRLENLPSDKAFTLFLAVLCHDLGKPTTTEITEEKITSYGHDKKGENPTREFLKSIGVDNDTYNKVVKLVTNHMKPTFLYTQEFVRKEKVTDKAIRKLAQKIYPATIQELVLVAEADHNGRGPFTDPKNPIQLLLPDGFPARKWLLKRARDLDVEKSKPTDLIMGRELISLGYKPGPNFGKIIKLANDLRDEKEFTKDQFFKEIIEIKNTEVAIEKLVKLLKKQTT